MLRDARRDPLLILILSVYLLLLAFFILLNNISKSEAARTRSVAGSLETAFASWGRPTSTPAAFTSALGNLQVDDSLERRLGSLVEADLRLARFEVIDKGRLMQLRVDEAALFSGPDDRMSSTGRRLIDRIAAELNNPPRGVRYNVEIRLSRGRAGERGLNDHTLSRIRRAATLSQALAAAGVRRGTLAAGVEQTGSTDLRFLFEIRPDTAPPNFDDAGGN